MSNTKSFNAFAASTKIQETKKATPKNNENSNKYLTLTAFAKELIEKYGDISGKKLADYSKGLKILEGIAITCEGEISVNNVYKTCTKKITGFKFAKDDKNIEISNLYTNPNVYLSLKFKEDEDLCFSTRGLECVVINNDAVKSFLIKDANGKPSQVLFFNYTVVRPPPEEVEEDLINIEDFEGEPLKEIEEEKVEEIKPIEKVETPEKKKKSKK